MINVSQERRPTYPLGAGGFWQMRVCKECLTLPLDLTPHNLAGNNNVAVL